MNFCRSITHGLQFYNRCSGSFIYSGKQFIFYRSAGCNRMCLCIALQPGLYGCDLGSHFRI